MNAPDSEQSPPSRLDIGGVALSRRELAEVLPDLERFETHLTDALAVDSYMRSGDGTIPGYARQWSEERLTNVIATLKELGSLREQLGQQHIGPEHDADSPKTGDRPH